MEETPLVYKKDKRTKNLTLRDIHIGDWVQEWSPTAERYSPPMRVSCIDYDGTIYLVSDDEHYCNPAETEIENVDALPITPELLIGFGFEADLLGRFYVYKNSVFAEDKQLNAMDISYLDKYGEAVYLEDIEYMHELQQALYEERNFVDEFIIEWKGVNRDV